MTGKKMRKNIFKPGHSWSFEEQKISNWKNEEAKWASKAAQMREVQSYGVMKFLAEKLVASLDDSVLYVCQRNIEWRNSLIK